MAPKSEIGSVPLPAPRQSTLIQFPPNALNLFREVVSMSNEYALGYSTEEERRLAQQAEVFEPLTTDVFRHAGIGADMRVLDIGCGIGDVSIVAARMVGPGGTVLGIDRAEESILTARRRTKGLGVDNVAFVATDIASFATEETFDAIVGRLILLYFRDPSATLRQLSSFLRPGGIVVFQEIDMSTLTSLSSSTLAERVANWIRDAFAAAGVQTEMGPRLPDIFINAGFPRPQMIAGQRVASGFEVAWPYDVLAGTVKSLMPVMERAKIATAAEIAIDTLADRLREEAIKKGKPVAYSPRLVGAWARKAGS
jgi:2-polyprenyl-3-methyl-5-hydroxy-6-metoxy-1,4-benzoquinol methylase